MIFDILKGSWLCLFIGIVGCKSAPLDDLRADFQNSSVKTRRLASNLASSMVASEVPEMEYVEVCRVGKTDCRKFSKIILGTDHLAAGNWTHDGQAPPSEEDVRALLAEAVRLGINTFDTSPIYVEGIESKLGKWIQEAREEIKSENYYYLKSSNPDKKLYVISKGGFPYDLYYSQRLPPGPHSEALLKKLWDSQILLEAKPNPATGSALQHVPPGTYASRLFGARVQITKNVLEELSHSYPQLNEEIAIYLMHRDDGDFLNFSRVERAQTPVVDILEALSGPILREKFWTLGWSNWTTPRVNESLRLSVDNQDLVKPSFNSPFFSLFEMSGSTIHAGGVQVIHEDMMNPNFQKGIKIMPYSPLGGFSILDQKDPIWDKARSLAKAKADRGDAYWRNVYAVIFTPENEARFNRAVAFTREYNALHGTHYSVDQVVNAYALAHPRVDFLIVGPINLAELHRTVGALKLSKELTPKDLSFLHRGH